MVEKSELILSLALLQTRVLKRIDQKLSLHGLSFSEFTVLYHLIQAPGQTMRRIDVAEKVGLTASGVTRLLNPMEKIGLVQKEANPRDARVSLVQLTATGEQILNDATISFEQSAEAILAPLNTRQVASLAELTKVL